MKTIPNLLTLSRLLSFPFLLLFLYHFNGIGALCVFFFAVLSDVLDGYIARRTSTVTDFGQLLDPVVDKLFVLGTFIYFFIIDKIPLWFIGIVVFRDVIQCVGYFFLWLKKKRFFMPSGWPGKLATGSNFLVILFLIIYATQHSFLPVPIAYVLIQYRELIFMSLFIMASCFTVFSLFYYTVVWLRLYRRVT